LSASGGASPPEQAIGFDRPPGATTGRERGAEHPMATPVEHAQGLLGTLRRRWRVALAVLVLAVGTTLALSLHGLPQYDATAQILLQPSDAISQIIMPGLIPSSAHAQRDVDTNAALITAQPVVRAVSRDLHLRIGDRALARKVTVTGQSDSNLVSITARDASPELARRIASAFAQQYGAYRLTIARAALSDALKAGRARLRALERSAVTRPAVGALRARVAELEASAAVQSGGVQVVRPALRPSSPATPRPLRSAIVSAIVGLLVAVAAALVVQRADTRLLTRADVEAAYGAPVVALLPASRRLRRRRSDDQAILYAELAARLGYVGNDGPGVLMVSSAASGPSGGDVAARLAAQLAALDRRVIVVDADLRTGTEGADAPEVGVAGLRSVLEGRSSLAQELAEVHVVAGAGEQMSYQVLRSGGPVANPGALLGRSAMGIVLSQARVRSNVVIVQAPAPERVSESLPLAALSDGILLMAQLRRTTREDAAAGRSALEAVHGRVLGVIAVTRARRGSRRGASRPALAPSASGPAPARPAALRSVAPPLQPAAVSSRSIADPSSKDH
jgi:polysaccharide biosynthesis transport protein